MKKCGLEAIKLNNSTQISNQVLSTINRRSSARAYSTEQLTQSELDTILKAGLMAPTGMNRQEIHFTVVKGDNPVLAKRIANTVAEELNVDMGDVSVAIEEVPREEWGEKVYKAEIKNNPNIYHKPDYEYK